MARNFAEQRTFAGLQWKTYEFQFIFIHAPNRVTFPCLPSHLRHYVLFRSHLRHFVLFAFPAETFIVHGLSLSADINGLPAMERTLPFDNAERL